MRQRFPVPAGLYLLVFTASPAMAGDFSLGVGVSTLGLGAEAGYAFNERFAVRVGGYAFSYDSDGEEGGIEYDADIELENIGGVLDWHPFAGAFRLSGGWFSTDNGVDAVGVPGEGDTYEIGGVEFTEAEVGTLSGVGDLGSSGAYAGLGWVWGRENGGLTLSADAGVLFQDSLDVELSSSGGTLSSNPLLLDALEDEEQEFQDDVSDYDLYPVATLGIQYRF
jgi:hypothetical protein